MRIYGLFRSTLPLFASTNKPLGRARFISTVTKLKSLPKLNESTFSFHTSATVLTNAKLSDRPARLFNRKNPDQKLVALIGNRSYPSSYELNMFGTFFPVIKPTLDRLANLPLMPEAVTKVRAFIKLLSEDPHLTFVQETNAKMEKLGELLLMSHNLPTLYPKPFCAILIKQFVKQRADVSQSELEFLKHISEHFDMDMIYHMASITENNLDLFITTFSKMSSIANTVLQLTYESAYPNKHLNLFVYSKRNHFIKVLASELDADTIEDSEDRMNQLNQFYRQAISSRHADWTRYILSPSYRIGDIRFSLKVEALFEQLFAAKDDIAAREITEQIFSKVPITEVFKICNIANEQALNANANTPSPKA